MTETNQASESTSVERDRYDELLSENRVMLPGVEVLFAFLLTVVFAEAFDRVDDLGKAVFLVALTSAALTILMLTVPALLHRVADIDRDRRIELASRFQVAGSVTLGLSISAGLFVVVRFVFGIEMAIIVTGLVAATWIGLWYLLPQLMGVSDDSGERPSDG